MPDKNTSTPHVELLRDGIMFSELAGTREALINAGLAKADHFPAAPKRVSWSCEGPEESYYRIERRRGGVYHLTRRKERTPARIALGHAYVRAKNDEIFQRFVSRIVQDERAGHG